jgi:hypothetical protein
MNCYPQAAVERTMKIQEVILRTGCATWRGSKLKRLNYFRCARVSAKKLTFW